MWSATTDAHIQPRMASRLPRSGAPVREEFSRSGGRIRGSAPPEPESSSRTHVPDADLELFEEAAARVLYEELADAVRRILAEPAVEDLDI